MIHTRITTSRRLVLNTLSNVGAQAFAALVNFVMIGVFLDQLGAERYGVWIVVGSIFAYRGLLTMGLNSAVNRQIPVHLAEGDMRAVQRVVTTGFVYYVLVAAVLLLGTLGLYLGFDNLLAGDKDLVDDGRIAVVIVGSSYAVTLPLQVYDAALSSYQRYDLINAVVVAVLIARTAAVVAALWLGFGIIAVAAVFSLAEICLRFGSTFFAVGLMSGGQLRLASFEPRILRAMLTYGFSTMLYSSSILLIFKSADLVVGSLISASAVSMFLIAATPALLLATFMQMFAQAMKPAVSELDARNEKERVEEVAILAQKYSLIILLPAVAFLLLMGDSFLDIWVGSRFEPDELNELYGVQRILVVGVGLLMAQHTNFMVLVGKGQHRIFGISAALMFMVNALLSSTVVRYLGGGLQAVAWSCCLSMAVVSTIVLPGDFSRKMEIPLSRSLHESWGPAFLAAAPVALVIAVWRFTQPASSWAELITAIVVAGAIAIATAWLFAIRSDERARIRSMLPF